MFHNIKRFVYVCGKLSLARSIRQASLHFVNGNHFRFCPHHYFRSVFSMQICSIRTVVGTDCSPGMVEGGVMDSGGCGIQLVIINASTILDNRMHSMRC